MEVVDKLKVKDRRKITGKERKARKLYLVAAILALVCTIGSVFSAVEYQNYSASYRSDISLAQMGIQHLRKAATLIEALPHNPLDAATVQNAQHEFGSALTAFVRINNDLKSLPAISTFIPIYGTRLSAALHLLPPAIEVSQMGIVICNTLDLLISRLHDTLNIQEHGLTMADLTVVDQNFQQIREALNLINDQIDHLQPGDLQLDPRLGKLVATFHKNIPTLQAWFDDIEKLLPALPVLLGIGTPTNYLIEVLDSTELRPGGGFIGNYGIATFSGGRLIYAHITDVDLLDRASEAAGHKIPFPSAYAWFDLGHGIWSLRDSNLDADFPTAARYGELNYAREGGRIHVQGVLAITPALIQHALEIIGPVYVPEYHETVTAQNLIARIHYYQLGIRGEGPDTTPSPDGHSSLRKRFTELLAEHFLARVGQLGPTTLPKLLGLIVSSVHSKDVQIYFNSDIAEHLLQHLHLDAAIQAPVGDSFFVVDANIASNKANNFIIYTLHDNVTVDLRGNAIHRTTISYAWTLKGQYYGGSYRDYVRVYVPPGSNLQMQDGWQPRGMSEAFGREVWAGYFTLAYGQTLTITLIWTVPGAARKDANGWHYQYLIQRQAGVQWTLHLQITLLPCAVVTNKWGGLLSSMRQVAVLTQSLNEDASLGLDYTCR